MSVAATDEKISQAMSRRAFLGTSSATGVLGILALNGCAYYEAEEGAAYAPWGFPNGESRPEWLAVGAAILAANPHNTQPWRFEVSRSRIDMHVVPSRDLRAMDPLGRERFIGLGCALFNLELAAAWHGLGPQVELFPLGEDHTLVARVTLGQGTARASELAPLYGAIANRHTNRGEYADVAVPHIERELSRHLDGTVTMKLMTTGSERTAFRNATIAATRAIVTDRKMLEDSERWYRHSKDAIDRHRDGITLDTTGNSAFIRGAGKVVGRPDVEAHGEYWLEATTSRQLTGRTFVVLATPSLESRADAVRCGRVYQRMHLWATDVSLACQPLNQVAERRDREVTEGLQPRFGPELDRWLGGQRHGQMLFRIGYPWDRAAKSPRRPVSWVAEELS